MRSYHHHASLPGLCYQGDEQCWVFSKWSPLYQGQNFADFSTCLLTNYGLPLFHKARFCGVSRLWLSGTVHIRAVALSGFFRNPWPLASKTKTLLTLSLTFGGRPPLGRITDVPYSLHLFTGGFEGCSKFWIEYLCKPLKLASNRNLTQIFIYPAVCFHYWHVRICDLLIKCSLDKSINENLNVCRSILRLLDATVPIMWMYCMYTSKQGVGKVCAYVCVFYSGWGSVSRLDPSHRSESGCTCGWVYRSYAGRPSGTNHRSTLIL